MKKIKIYIVTYKAKEELHNNLESLFASDLTQYDFEINIINNHSDFYIDNKFVNKVNVLHNVLRPDFSCGHLARNWNQAIINGFKDLNNPDCDILVTAQDDSIFKQHWCSKIIEYHKKYSLITIGAGDGYVSYTADAIKNIGLWDERFCGIHFQETDYFLRALMYNKEKSSINDLFHGRILNEIPGNFFNNKKIVPKVSDVGNHDILINPAVTEVKKSSHISSANLSLKTNKEFLSIKYGKEIQIDKKRNSILENWQDNDCYILKNPPTIKIPTFIFYPYFEKDINHLLEKNYSLPLPEAVETKCEKADDLAKCAIDCSSETLELTHKLEKRKSKINRYLLRFIFPPLLIYDKIKKFLK